MSGGVLDRYVRPIAEPARKPAEEPGAFDDLGAFGLLRGVLLLMVVATVVGLTPAATSPEWHRSQGVQWLAVALQGFKPLLPPELAQHFRS